MPNIRNTHALRELFSPTDLINPIRSAMVRRNLFSTCMQYVNQYSVPSCIDRSWYFIEIDRLLKSSSDSLCVVISIEWLNYECDILRTPYFIGNNCSKCGQGNFVLRTAVYGIFNRIIARRLHLYRIPRFILAATCCLYNTLLIVRTPYAWPLMVRGSRDTYSTGVVQQETSR